MPVAIALRPKLEGAAHGDRFGANGLLQ